MTCLTFVKRVRRGAFELSRLGTAALRGGKAKIKRGMVERVGTPSNGRFSRGVLGSPRGTRKINSIRDRRETRGTADMGRQKEDRARNVD